MAGLLGESIDDPRTMAVFAGIQGLLSGRGLAQGISSGLLNYGGQMQQAKQQAAMEEERKQRAAMQALQMQQQQMMLEQAKQAQAQRQGMTDAARESMVSPAQQALAGGGGPTSANAQKLPGLSPQFDWAGYANRIAAIDPMASLQVQQATRKDTSPQITKAGDIARDPRTGQIIWQNPAEGDKAPEAIRAIEAVYGKGSPQAIKAQQDYITKMTTHQPGVNVSYGAPVAGVDSSGKPVFFQPTKDGKSPPSIIQGVAPPKKDAPVEFTKSIAGLKELEFGLKSYEDTLKNEGGVNPVAFGGSRAALKGAYTSLNMGLKNAFELGALAGPDLELLQGMLVDPTSPKAALIGDDGVARQIEKARDYLKNRTRAVYEAHGQGIPMAPARQDPFAPNQPQNDPLGLFTDRRNQWKK